MTTTTLSVKMRVQATLDPESAAELRLKADELEAAVAAIDKTNCTEDMILRVNGAWARANAVYKRSTEKREPDVA